MIGKYRNTSTAMLKEHETAPRIRLVSDEWSIYEFGWVRELQVPENQIVILMFALSLEPATAVRRWRLRTDNVVLMVPAIKEHVVRKGEVQAEENTNDLYRVLSSVHKVPIENEYVVGAAESSWQLGQLRQGRRPSGLVLSTCAPDKIFGRPAQTTWESLRRLGCAAGPRAARADPPPREPVGWLRPSQQQSRW